MRVGVDRESGGEALEDHDERAAVRFAGSEKPQHSREIVYEVSARSRRCRRRIAGVSPDWPSGDALCTAVVLMQVFADRFVVDRGEPIDLATGELVRLTVEAAPDRATAQARSRLCDQLSALRHPLLVPLIDYGVAPIGGSKPTSRCRRCARHPEIPAARRSIWAAFFRRRASTSLETPSSVMSGRRSSRLGRRAHGRCPPDRP